MFVRCPGTRLRRRSFHCAVPREFSVARGVLSHLAEATNALDWLNSIDELVPEPPDSNSADGDAENEMHQMPCGTAVRCNGGPASPPRCLQTDELKLGPTTPAEVEMDRITRHGPSWVHLSSLKASSLDLWYRAGAYTAFSPTSYRAVHSTGIRWGPWKAYPADPTRHAAEELPVCRSSRTSTPNWL